MGKAQKGGDAAESGEMEGLVDALKRLFDKEKAEKMVLKLGMGKLEAEGKAKDERIRKLEHENRKMRDFAESQTKRIQATEEKLKQTEELLVTRSAKLLEVKTLSMEDRLSEAEVLGIVRGLNENIYQVAVKLTEEWEKLPPPKATNRKDARDARLPALIRRVRNRDPSSLTFLLQSRLCHQAANMTSSWGVRQELGVLESIYKRLSTSGEGHIVGAK